MKGYNDMETKGRGLQALVVVYSYHHHNTEKVARVMAEVLGAEVKAPRDVRPEELAGYDLVGFGSGVYGGKLHQDLLALAQAAPANARGKAFVFSTSGGQVKAEQREAALAKWHGPVKGVLEGKGWTVLGEWNCPGWLSMSILKLFGGLSRGRPNEADLAAAREFAAEMRRKAAG